MITDYQSGEYTQYQTYYGLGLILNWSSDVGPGRNTIGLTLQSRDSGLNLDTRNTSPIDLQTILKITDIWRISLVHSYTSPFSLRETYTYVAKAIGLTLRSRDSGLSLDSRNRDLTLRSRSTSLTLPERD